MENSEKDVVNGVQGCTVDLFGIPIPIFIWKDWGKHR